MNFLRFLVSKKFFKNLAIAIFIIIILVIAAFKFLDIYTLHGESITVPNFSGLKIEDLNQFSLNNEFKFVLLDSIYDNKKEKGTIIYQDPLQNTRVKKGRKIYLTVIAKLPEQVIMPNLLDLSLRQALGILETHGLYVDRLKYVPDIAQNAVLQQLYKDEIIEPGTKIVKGSKIDLVIGRGVDNIKTPVPFLIGKKQNEAIKTINEASLNIGNEYFLDGKEKEHSRVYKQYPAYNSDTLLKLGANVNLWYRCDENFDFIKLLESLKTDTLKTDTTLIDTVL